MKTVIGNNDDYACIWAYTGDNSWEDDRSKIYFYYGYEELPDHMQDEEDPDYCDEDWCFVAKQHGKILVKYTTQELKEFNQDLSSGDEPIKFLVVGMYMYQLKK